MHTSPPIHPSTTSTSNPNLNQQPQSHHPRPHHHPTHPHPPRPTTPPQRRRRTRPRRRRRLTPAHKRRLHHRRHRHAAIAGTRAARRGWDGAVRERGTRAGGRAGREGDWSRGRAGG